MGRYYLVTSDSTSMISEAATTGKPVYVIPMKGLTKRQNQLVENLKKHGAVKEFNGIIQNWTYPALSDSQDIATIIRKKCGLFE
jgi:mitochondrial fission protein ELM1